MSPTDKHAPKSSLRPSSRSSHQRPHESRDAASQEQGGAGVIVDSANNTLTLHWTDSISQEGMASLELGQLSNTFIAYLNSLDLSAATVRYTPGSAHRTSNAPQPGLSAPPGQPRELTIQFNQRGTNSSVTAMPGDIHSTTYSKADYVHGLEYMEEWRATWLRAVALAWSQANLKDELTRDPFTFFKTHCNYLLPPTVDVVVVDTPTDSWLPDLCAVWGSSPDNVIAVSRAGALRHYNGTCWNPLGVVQQDGKPVPLRAISGHRKSVVAVGESGKLVYCTDMSHPRWTVFDTDAACTLRGVWTDGTDVFAVGDAGALMTGPLGQLLKPVDISSLTSSDLNAVAGNKSGVVAVGANGTVVYKGEDDHWQATNVYGANLHGVWANETTIVAVGDGGAVFTSTWANIHLTWTKLPSPISDNLRAISGQGPLAIAVGDSGAAVSIDLQDGVGTCNQVKTHLTSALNGVWTSPLHKVPDPEDILAQVFMVGDEYASHTTRPGFHPATKGPASPDWSWELPRSLLVMFLPPRPPDNQQAIALAAYEAVGKQYPFTMSS